ncbi:MAG: hypothetical protein L0L39_05855 [Atopostipes suicloacalis]|nr:hypothetical protein [Atopostipes suicloacalis]MDN6630801.1 hypothetical protein [Staphylococcus equorum]MDN6731690.1 hypothetical protein [Atopostipes suicloacalis]
MIKISSAMQQDQIIDLLDDHTEEGISFNFKEKEGIALFFETDAEDPEKAAKLAKDYIKAQDWGSILFFQSIAV